jgi:mRNA interferase MazF
MITTRTHKEWPGDTEIDDFKTAGLPEDCIVRLKLFTIDNRLILKQVGRLAEIDRKRAAGNVRLYLL